MIKHEMNYRVLYADTDAMGVMYYANYLRVYEAARGEFMRNLDFSFREAEKKGIICPAINVNIEYLKFVEFDQEVKIVTMVKDVPRVKLEFIQEMYLSDGSLVNRATVKLGFVDKSRNKAVRCPYWIKQLFENNINN